jgi:uncharacterized membrane protein YdfJ with MMPL/SSD domain
MIEANVPTLKHFLSQLETESRRVRKILDVFTVADDATTLSGSQKSDILATVQAGQVASAYSDAAAVFTADEPIPIPEE